MAAPELLSDEGFRADGRRPEEIRKVRARLGVFARADGSAYIEQGNTKALAVVYGPHEVRVGRGRALPDRALVSCRFSLATFSTGERRRRPHGDRLTAELALHLRQGLEAAILTGLHPRSQIDVWVQILQSDGGELCAGLNAASLALLDAGVPLRDRLCGGSAGLAAAGGGGEGGEAAALADLSAAEEAAGGPRLALALLPGPGRLALLALGCRLPRQRLPPVLEAAAGACRALSAALGQGLRRRLREAAAMEEGAGE